MNPTPLEVVPVGSNETRLWGISVDERTRRIARARKLAVGPSPSAV